MQANPASWWGAWGWVGKLIIGLSASPRLIKGGYESIEKCFMVDIYYNHTNFSNIFSNVMLCDTFML